VYRLAREVESFGDPRFTRPPKRIRWRYAFRYALVIGVVVAVAFGIDWFLGTGAPGTLRPHSCSPCRRRPT